MRNRLLTILLCTLGIGALSACANSDTTSPTPDSNDDGEVRSSGMTLTSDTLADTDVSRMQFDVTGVDCASGQATGFNETKTKDLEDMMLPGGVSKFENAPLDEDSQHLFADAFFLVDAGCYDVRTQPLDDQGQPSADCEDAHRDRVSVEDGQTTEILLVNQCEGAERGGLDVVSSLNHAPEIDNLELEKFVSSCPTADQPSQICVTASDPDDDPLEFEWSTSDAAELQGDVVEVSSSQQADGRWESCANVTVNRKGDYAFEVEVYDLDGNGNRMEDVLAQQDSRDAHPSHDSLQFPVYSGADCRGRTATILMALGDHRSIEGPNSTQRADRFIRQSVSWASPLTAKPQTDILHVTDDNNQGEQLPQARQNVGQVLASNFASVDVIDEPAGGLRAADVQGYDLVWFSNPGWPMDDERSFDVLQDFSQSGGGLILEGDDMGRNSQGLAGSRDLEFFHGLEYLDNGLSTCGDITNNYSGNTYGVTFTQEPISTNDGLRGQSFQYDNDIDHVRRTISGERVLARATYSSGECSYSGPAAVALNPIDFMAP
jgi:hypothetical protein